MKTFKLFLMAALGVLVLCGPALAVDVLEPGYTTETFATYSASGIGGPAHMTFAGDGNLYLTHSDPGSIWRVTPAQQTNEFVTGLDRPRGIVWGGGTGYGDYLYVVEYGDNDIVRVALNGTTSFFAAMISGGHVPSPMGLDRSGNYDGHLYVGTTGQDHTYEINTSGSVSLFSDWPSWTDGGGPRGYAFDCIGSYSGLMYATANFVGTYQDRSGLFSLDTSGDDTRFSGLVTAFAVDFDLMGSFGNYMYVTGKTSWQQDTSIWRVAPDGTATEFARTTISGPSTMGFGPDGAMYIAEHLSDTITVTRVIPEPATLLLLGLGGLLLRRKN